MSATRLKKWIIVCVGLVFLLFVASVVTWQLILPPYVEKQIASVLRDKGFTGASVELGKLSMSRATLKDLRLGPASGVHIEEIEVQYSLASLRENRVEGVVLHGARARIGVQDGEADLGPFSDLRAGAQSERAPEGGSVLPFDRIELRNSVLQVDWEGRTLDIPLDAVVESTGPDSVSIGLNASVDGAALSLVMSVDARTRDASVEFEVDGVAAEFLRDLAEPRLSDLQLECDGYLDFKGRVTSQKGAWRGKMAVSENQLYVATALGTPKMDLSLGALRADLDLQYPGVCELDAEVLLNSSPVIVHAKFDPRSADGECRFGVEKVDQKSLSQLLAVYFPHRQFEFGGPIRFDGTASNRSGRVTAELSADCDRLSLNTPASGQRLRLERPVLGAKVQSIYREGKMSDVRGRLELGGTKITLADSIREVAADTIECRMLFSLDEKSIEGADFEIVNVRSGPIAVPLIKGHIVVVNDTATVDLSGNILPEAVFEASGTIGLGTGRPSGGLDVHVPRFALQSTALLTENVPALAESEIEGIVTADAHIDLQDGRITPLVRIDVEGASWRRPEKGASKASKASIEGLSGTLTISNLAPIATADEQRFTFDTMAFGAFTATDGILRFRVNGDDTTVVGSVECSWSGGKLWSDSILVEPTRSTIGGELHAEKIDLQGILEFLDYDGVRGDGRIYGNLPLSVEWGKRTRVSFGDGILKANPQKGRLQLSKKTAMTILGLTHEIDPESTENQDMAKLLMMRALQDMEYSTLQVTFEDREERGWVTHVQIKGHGPVGDPENRVPIAGLNIEINHLDDLLNSIILPGLRSERFGPNG